MKLYFFYFVKMFLKMEFNKLNWTELNTVGGGGQKNEILRGA